MYEDSIQAVACDLYEEGIHAAASNLYELHSSSACDLYEENILQQMPIQRHWTCIHDKACTDRCNAANVQ